MTAAGDMPGDPPGDPPAAHPEDIRDFCQWRGCAAPSSIVFLRVGLCDGHWEQACSVYQSTKRYVRARVVPEAAAEMAD